MKLKINYLIKHNKTSPKSNIELNEFKKNIDDAHLIDASFKKIYTGLVAIVDLE